MDQWWFFHVDDLAWLLAWPVLMVFVFLLIRGNPKSDQERYDAITRRIYENDDDRRILRRLGKG